MCTVVNDDQQNQPTYSPQEFFKGEEQEIC